MSIILYTPEELPASDRYTVEELGYKPEDYTFIGVAMYDHGRDMLEEAFPAAHLIEQEPEYEDEDVVFHYALIGLKKK